VLILKDLIANLFKFIKWFNRNRSVICGALVWVLSIQIQSELNWIKEQKEKHENHSGQQELEGIRSFLRGILHGGFVKNSSDQGKELINIRNWDQTRI
jgi:hypothetical protein